MMKASYYQIRFLEEAEKRTNLPFEILKRSIQPEYSAILQGTFPLSVLEERARNGAFVHIHNDLSYDIITGKSYQSVEEYFEKKFEVNQTTTSLKGMSASSGTVQGKVKIVLRIEDIEKVNEGDILVASMTRPEMIVAMQKASAFITDEGGITCHAAIVARELKKPCIIGTKIATQVLKDGDLVEVDADAGVVRILEQTRPITTLGEIKEN
jgi:phosphohistidine swiveling domain-containing protein